MEVEITYRSILLRIEGVYSPEEKGYRYDNDLSGLPMSYSSFDIEGIFATDSDVDIYELVSMADITEIETEVINKIEERWQQL